MPRKYTLEERINKFWERVDKSGGDDACWEWVTGKKSNGYGSFRWQGEAQNAHRVAWIISHGNIPKGHHISHSCDNRACCNPTHLRLRTNSNQYASRTYEEKVALFWSRVDKSGGDDSCWIWTAYMCERGYGITRWQRKMKKAHRVSWNLTYGDIPDGMFVCHTCDNPSCVNPSHLWIGTTQDNMDDMMRKGRHVTYSGEKNGNAKLTWAQVREIRRRYATEHISQTQLGEEFGVGKSIISYIINHVNWKE